MGSGQRKQHQQKYESQLAAGCITRVGQNRIYIYIYLCMTVCSVIFLPRIPYINCTHMVVANPMHNSSRVRNIHTVVGVRDSSQKKQHQQKYEFWLAAGCRTFTHR